MMAYQDVSVCSVSLPCFAGYTEFALWPAPHLVSKTYQLIHNFTFHHETIHISLLQEASCYGLLDVNSILSPNPTGQYVKVKYYPGFQYVAYRSSDPMQVCINLEAIMLLRILILRFQISQCMGLDLSS